MTRRLATLTGLLLLTLVASTAASLTPPGAASSVASVPAAAAAQLTTVRLGIIPITGFLDFYFANEQGYLQQEGISVEITLMAGGAEILPALIGGSLDIGIANVFSHVLARDQGFDVKAIAGPSVQRRGASLHAILVRADSPIQGARDMEGRTIATNTLNNIDHLMQQIWLQNNGVDPRRVNFVEIPFPQQPAALAAGRVDVIAPAEPFSTMAQVQGARLIAHHYTDTNDVTAIAYYAATGDWLNRNGDTARRFARAIARAGEYFAANPDERRGAAMRTLNLPSEVATRQNFEEWLPRAYLPGIQWWIDAGRSFGLVQNALNPEDFVFDTIR
jgi:NitT/TauT family transport system substrate-binding protein